MGRPEFESPRRYCCRRSMLDDLLLPLAVRGPIQPAASATASSVNSRLSVMLTTSPASTMPPGIAHSPVSFRLIATNCSFMVDGLKRVTIGSAA